MRMRVPVVVRVAALGLVRMIVRVIVVLAHALTC
jgi:hypothetical protein